jgi:hypothetical protein
MVMLSERMKQDLRNKVDARLVDLRDASYKTTRRGVVAYCPVCARGGLFRCKSGTTQADALAALEIHLDQSHGMRLARPQPAAVDASVEQEMFATAFGT